MQWDRDGNGVNWTFHDEKYMQVRRHGLLIVMVLINFFIRRCQGKGTWNKNPCSDCKGHGQANHRKKVLVSGVKKCP